MFPIQLKSILVLCCLFFSVFCYAGQAGEAHPFYLGGLGGYGSTTWEGLVPTQENDNLAMNLSTPIQVTEGGAVWGGFVGYELTPQFALELSYIRYPDAFIDFDEISLFSFMNDGVTSFTTLTDTVNFMGKFMIYIPRTAVRAYSSVGAAGVHRNDMLLNDWRLSPTFGLGLNYHFTPHFMGEVEGNYTAGFGESQLNPTSTYFPFLYAISLRLAYCV